MGKSAQNKRPALERNFEDNVVAILRRMGFYVTPKINTHHRGLPDRFVCADGLFFGVEFKRDKKEMGKKTGRAVLQNYILEARLNGATYEEIARAGGGAYVIYPDNLDDFLEDMKEYSNE